MKKILIGIVLVALVAGFLYFKDYIFKDPFVELGYSKISSEKIKDLDLKEKVNEKYSKTLDIALNDTEYKNDYVNEYLNIDYVEIKNFISYINTLLDNNSSYEEINKISPIFKIKYFKEDNLLRYANYKKNNTKLSNEEIVIYVNIGLDEEFYTNIKEIAAPDDLLVLVNKYNKLQEDYTPSDLTTFNNSYTITSSKRQMRKTAYDSMVKMIDDIRKENMDLWINSAYRTKDTQNYLFTNSTNNNGLEHALKYSAKPRHSEHETGLAADISSVKGMLDGFEKYDEYEWLTNNAYKYGFIERYPKGKENITGYSYEPWHYRYVGIEAATKIKEENITFEEYCVKYLGY